MPSIDRLRPQAAPPRQAISLAARRLHLTPRV
ncbi:hypothetical protein AWB65_03076 [Caballeronia humi]|uniref:Uncharacterized protein n=1 Tax=Caballeronia humi TaxID=326474 RepID=A0A158H903_9BURK|nr:hypothetical protein AWB65_03076 [Caballeronia humi]